MLGWPGIEVGEDFGGAGGRFGDLAVILVELGRHLCSNGLIATSALGAGPLLGCRAEQPRRTVAAPTGRGRLPCRRGGRAHADPITSGRARAVTVGWCPARRPCVARCRRDPIVVILPVTDADGAILVFAVDPTTSGLTWTDAPMLDITRRFADLDAEGLEVGAAEAPSPGTRGGAALIADLLNRAALATACDAFGVAEQALQMTTAYAKERVQFDRPIGSFQAVKHRCADMFIAVETARAVLDDAIDRYDAAPAAAAVAISRAKAYCCDAAAQVTEDAVELHGGIGFTWEHDMHLYVKRARLDQALFGDSRWHRRRVAALTLD